MTLPELIDKWKEIKFESEAWTKTLAPKYRIGTTVYTQVNQILFHIVDDLENLQKHTGAITEPAHFANTMLGEVCHKEGNSNNAENSRAGSSETLGILRSTGGFAIRFNPLPKIGFAIG